MRVSHVIATKGRPAALRVALESIVDASADDCEIIVVDGDPARSAEEVIAQTKRPSDAQPIRYVTGVSGLCAQRNKALDMAEGDIVIFTDDDSRVTPGFYEALLEAYQDPSVVGATGRELEPRDARIGSGANSRLRRAVLFGGRQGTMTSFGFRRPIVDVDRPHLVEYMPGSFMSARRAHAAEVRFDENLERLAGYGLGEDDDFSYRLSRRGPIRYVPSAVAHHDELGARTIDRRALDRLMVINRTYLYRKNFAGTLRGKMGLAGLFTLIFAHRIINREWQGVRGLVDGFREASRVRVDAHGRDG